MKCLPTFKASKRLCKYFIRVSDILECCQVEDINLSIRIILLALLLELCTCIIISSTTFSLTFALNP